jgi:hypothetical protein
MKSVRISIMANVFAATIVIGMTTIGIQHAFAPRQSPGCGEFKKLSHEFEKAVLGATQSPP